MPVTDADVVCKHGTQHAQRTQHGFNVPRLTLAQSVLQGFYGVSLFHNTIQHYLQRSTHHSASACGSLNQTQHAENELNPVIQHHFKLKLSFKTRDAPSQAQPEYNSAWSPQPPATLVT